MPTIIARVRCLGGRPPAARPMTRALSPNDDLEEGDHGFAGEKISHGRGYPCRRKSRSAALESPSFVEPRQNYFTAQERSSNFYVRRTQPNHAGPTEDSNGY